MKVKCAIAAFCFLRVLALGQSDTDLLARHKKDLNANPKSSIALFRIGEIYFQNSNFQSAANSFAEALNGDLQPKWIEVWSHIYLGKIFDITSQRDRAFNQYALAQQTNDNTRGALEEASIYLHRPYPGDADVWAEYEKELKATPQSSATVFRTGEINFQKSNFQAAANSFAEALKGDLQPKWIEVWSHVYLGKVSLITGQLDRALAEYTLAQQTNDDTRGAMDEVAISSWLLRMPKYVELPNARGRGLNFGPTDVIR